MANFFTALRRDYLSVPLLRHVRRVLPPLSETERAALEAGTVWWDAELFRGDPDWDKLLSVGPLTLAPEEQAFLDGPVEELCAMVDDWQVSFTDRDLPPEVWEFIKARGFLGMIIPKEYGGLGFSAAAHSAVVAKLSTRSLTAAVTVMVPNSLGPGELLHLYGTDKQKSKYLPRLATGEELPCFALTSPEAGSDAASMRDSGVIAYGDWEGDRVLGLQLNWSKRYITLAPRATLLGLAFKAYDPDGLLGGEADLGITVALIPTDMPGVVTGRRHYPALQAFLNGPTEGRDVFVPLDFIIGGREQIGQGWKMLMGALAAGRGISLPALSTGGVQFAARVTGAYARIREQFGLPIGRFEGVAEALARIGASAYQLEAARRITAQAIDRGEKPAVVSAIMKLHATEQMRDVVNDAMDIHGGKTVIDGPRNYLANAYRGIPVAITVEGANILTRSLIVFGQGAIRCHPHLIAEMEAAADPDKKRALKAFDAALGQHLGHVFRNFGRAFGRAWTGGGLAKSPITGPTTTYFRQIMRYSAALAFVADVTLAMLGGRLKRMEMLSARLGDVLSELYLASAGLARFECDGRPAEDLPLVRWSTERSLHRIEQHFDRFLANFPSRVTAGLLRLVVLPFGLRRRMPDDRLTLAVAELLLTPGAARDRLTGGIYAGAAGDPVAVLEEAFRRTHLEAPLRKKMRDAEISDIGAAVAAGILSDAEGAEMERTAELTEAAIAVDDFPPELLSATAPSPATVSPSPETVSEDASGQPG